MIPFLQSIEPIILGVHFLICFFLIISILLQTGKGADMGAAFGVGSSQTIFGARGATTFLSKITTVAAFIFLTTSIFLATIHKNKLNSSGVSSVVEAPVAAEPAVQKTDEEKPVVDKP